DKDAKPLTPDEAAKKVNEKCTVELEVQSTGGSSNYYLNSKKNYRDAGNFTVFISKESAEKFKTAKIDNPADHYKGKTIRVTGTGPGRRRGQAERAVHRHRRPSRLGRLSGRRAGQDAEPGPARPARAVVHAQLLRRAGLQPDADGPPNRLPAQLERRLREPQRL